MQEHVKLEVSLEIIMSKIADAILDKKDKKELLKLIEIKDRAYKGEKDAVQEILNIGG